jgi:transposase
LFSYVDLEARVRKDHPLRTIRRLVNETLAIMERDFAALYAGIGRPSIAPEKLLRSDAAASLLLGALRAPTDGAAGV